MSARVNVTTAMLWIGVLVIASQGWLKTARNWIQKLSGSAPSFDDIDGGTAAGGSGFSDDASAGGGSGGGGGGSW